MKKKELIVLIAGDTGLTQKDAAAVVDSLVNNIEAAVANGECVYLSVFGTFSPRPRAPRKARNPRSGETVSVPARTVPQFRPGKEFLKRMGE